jgi:hypothetical protein
MPNPFDQRAIKVGPATYDRITAVKAALEVEKQRQVTYAESVEYLLTYWETTAGLRAAEAGR